MILRYIDKKDVWNSKDLIVHFGLYVNQKKDRVEKNSFGMDILSYKYDDDRFFSLDSPIDDSIFFATENPDEWLRLCERFDFISEGEIAKANITHIVCSIAKAQGIDENIFKSAIDSNQGSFGITQEIQADEEENIKKDDEKEQKRTIEDIAKEKIEKNLNSAPKDLIADDDTFANIMSGALESAEDNDRVKTKQTRLDDIPTEGRGLKTKKAKE